MQEVTVRLRFSRECLGSVRRRGRRGQVIFSMLRDPAGNVMFLPSWWHKALKYAANVANSSQGLVAKIAWDTVIDGSVRRDWRRIITAARADARGRERYAMHEAFVAGSTIGVNAVLPDGLPLESFHRLLEIVGRYKGISPFVGEEDTYGTFDVVSVKPTVRGLCDASQEPELTATK